MLSKFQLHFGTIDCYAKWNKFKMVKLQKISEETCKFTIANQSQNI